MDFPILEFNENKEYTALEWLGWQWYAGRILASAQCIAADIYYDCELYHKAVDDYVTVTMRIENKLLGIKPSIIYDFMDYCNDMAIDKS